MQRGGSFSYTHILTHSWLPLSCHLEKFPGGSAGIHLQCGRPGFDSWVGKFLWRRERLPTPEFWPGEFHGLYSPWDHRVGVNSSSILWVDQLKNLIAILSIMKSFWAQSFEHNQNPTTFHHLHSLFFQSRCVCVLVAHLCPTLQPHGL